MKTLLIAAAAAGLTGAGLSPVQAGEHITLTVQSQAAQAAFSDATISLNQGDTAELVFCSYVVDDVLGPSFVSIATTVSGKPFTVPVARLTSKSNAGAAYELNRVKVSGPATLRLRMEPAAPQRSEFATIEVNRVGNASPPAGIPQEANTNWQVILEASTDLELWTAVPAGDYAGNTPQRFFRVRIVKQP